MDAGNKKTSPGKSIRELTITGKKPFVIIREWILIAVGLFMYAFAWKALLLPYQITGGGATGVAALVYYATGIPMFAIYLAINAVLLFVAIKVIGWQFSFRLHNGDGCIIPSLKFDVQIKGMPTEVKVIDVVWLKD